MWVKPLKKRATKEASAPLGHTFDWNVEPVWSPCDIFQIEPALGTWVFSVAGALLAIPVGIKRKSLAPLVFFGTTGTMLDIIMGISQCEREHAERQMKLLEEQNAAAMGALTETGTES
ncbi:hypothetical protein TEA_004824 [Camellia sinensis var. sinensis]|uniref:Uncharacterized protein n=1 Tax=Camellia sinensis var. sinensis TaxID=542762 RepID=A0A4S4F0M1_CAMSN|nr:hypothetical protein TEA_004824 [Camellia sinensis var. sinensis]